MSSLTEVKVGRSDCPLRKALNRTWWPERHPEFKGNSPDLPGIGIPARRYLNFFLSAGTRLIRENYGGF